MRRIDPKVEQQVVAAYLSSPSGGRTLATQLGIGATTLYRVLSRNGVPITEEKRYGRSVRRNALTEQQEAEVIERYRNGERSVALSKAFSCARETVLAILRRHGMSGVTGRPRSAPNANLQADLQRAAEMAADGLSQEAIAKEFGVNQTTVSGWLRMQGIDRSRFWRGSRAGASWKGGKSKTSSGYIVVTLPPGHALMPMAHVGGSVLEHRLVMASHLGRPLTKSETVHHINGNRTDNRLENLELRVGKHGRGVRMVCADCGSHNVRAVELRK